MSRGLKYTMPFASLDGRQYTANVYVEGFTGTATTLTAAAEPFYTAELSDHEWLTVPVRTQSGYMRIVCNEDEWRGLVPTSAMSHYVELVEGGAVRWLGYIKPETFTHSLYSGTDEYEFPLQCPLSALEGVQLPWDASESSNTFARLLSRVLSLAGVTWGDCYFVNNIVQHGPTLSGPTADLAASVSIVRYYEIETEQENNLDVQNYVPSASALEILGDVCQFWGWELHMHGTDLYFTAYDEHAGFRGVPFADLATLTQTYAPTFNAEGLAPVEGAVYMTAQHQVELAQPAKKVSVKTDIDEHEDIIDVTVDDVANFTAMPTTITERNGKISADCTPLRTTYNGVLSNGTIITWDGHPATDTAARDYLVQQGLERYYYPIFRRLDEWNSSDSASKYKYNLSDIMFLSPCPEYNVNSGYSILKFETAIPYNLSDCAICLHANIDFAVESSATGSVQSPLSVMVMLGDYYWDPSNQAWLLRPTGSWQGAYFDIPTGNKSNPSSLNISGEIVPNFNYQTLYQGAEGYMLPVEVSINGKLAIYIRRFQYEMGEFITDYASLSMRALQFHKLHDFGVSVVRKQPATGRGVTLEDSRTYSDTHDNNSGVDVSVDVKFATDNNNKFGTAFVVNSSGAYMQSLAYADGDIERPEVHLCDRLSALYSTPTEWREIDVADTGAKYISPRYALKDTSGHYWAPVATARQWAEGIVRLTIGDMGTWTPPASYNLADCNDWLLLTSNDEPLVVVGG